MQSRKIFGTSENFCDLTFFGDAIENFRSFNNGNW